MRVDWTGALTGNEIATAVSELGYGVTASGTDSEGTSYQAEERSLLIAMGVAGFAAANIMLLSVSVWGGAGEMGAATRQAFHAISGMIALPVVVFSGRHFFLSAWRALKHGHVNMDVPVSLAIWLAMGVSIWETIQGGPHAYFDACIMLIFFLLIGRFLDARLRRRASGAAHDLAALKNRSVRRQNSTGAIESVRANEIIAGDMILLSPGEQAVIDMTIAEGAGEIDEQLVSGESLPRLVNAGTVVFAGSVNLGAALIGQAISPATDSLLADIATMMEAGEQRRSTYRKIADRAVALYVPFVHTTAALSFLGWIVAGASVREAILIAVSTLIITCPCALALAAPAAQMVASGKLFRSGVFLRSGDALERLAAIDHIVFDKTGTLTLGEPVCLVTENTRKALPIAAMLARASRHPLSRALVTAAGAGPLATGIREHAGLGLEANIDGHVCRLGSAEWVGAGGEVAGEGPVLWFSRGSEPPIAFTFEEQLRDDAKAAVRALETEGYSLEILSGDRPSAVARTAGALGIGVWSARVSPQDKAARLEALRDEGKRVLMVGDGLNDAGALALAHASLTPGGAMDISQSASDAVYAGGLGSIPAILRISKSARQIMLQNFGLAAAYNLIAVPIAVTGHVTPLIAAIAMSASSLIVTLNALRIRHGKSGSS
ncbi:copper-translocating P-type ATPase [Hyphomonas johnsonii MHS-2]|uniref:Copper-translocating P-type ATPase n=2 Tax=Hyphomonas johnsonii TaxID=81031 RepID=A0A059FRW5_9PROT|nr:copper-translocating P-type ATPase [Hyphomonas johnsonii MHS-2]